MRGNTTIQRDSSRTAFDVPSLRPGEFAKIARLAYDHFGLDLPADKQAMVAARLSKALRRLGLDSFTAYYEHVVGDRTGQALDDLVDDLTTNHTGFFRESRHFDFLSRTIIPEYSDKAINVWSAACSTGEEPYSIAICLAEALRNKPRLQTRILASDISTRAIQKARAAIYPEERFKEFPAPLLSRYLLRSTQNGSTSYRMKDEIRHAVTFQKVNLMKPLPGTQQFSVIFCRNVMIYFDRITQQNLVSRLLQRLETGGYLLIGHAESLNGIDHDLEYVSPATYRKPDVPQAPRERRRL